MMGKAVIFVLLGLLVGFLLANNFVQSEVDKNSAIIVKLDKILANQEEMFTYLKFIKNRSR